MDTIAGVPESFLEEENQALKMENMKSKGISVVDDFSELPYHPGWPISHPCTIPGRCSSHSTLVVILSLVLIPSGLIKSNSVNE